MKDPRFAYPFVTRDSAMSSAILEKLILVAYTGTGDDEPDAEELARDRAAARVTAEIHGREGYDDHRCQQIKAAGGHVRRGDHGHWICIMRTVSRSRPADGADAELDAIPIYIVGTWRPASHAQPRCTAIIALTAIPANPQSVGTAVHSETHFASAGLRVPRPYWDARVRRPIRHPQWANAEWDRRRTSASTPPRRPCPGLTVPSRPWSQSPPLSRPRPQLYTRPEGEPAAAPASVTCRRGELRHPAGAGSPDRERGQEAHRPLKADSEAGARRRRRPKQTDPADRDKQP